jgi:gamma-tubulin complex component 2
VEGTLIRYEEGYDPLDESQRIQGARWSVDPSLGSLNIVCLTIVAYRNPDPSLLSVVERLLPLATSFTSVEAYMELRYFHSAHSDELAYPRQKYPRTWYGQPCPW